MQWQENIAGAVRQRPPPLLLIALTIAVGHMINASWETIAHARWLTAIKPLWTAQKESNHLVGLKLKLKCVIWLAML